MSRRNARSSSLRVGATSGARSPAPSSCALGDELQHERLAAQAVDVGVAAEVGEGAQRCGDGETGEACAVSRWVLVWWTTRPGASGALRAVAR